MGNIIIMMKRLLAQRTRSEKAFTLVEILVAILISSIVLAGITLLVMSLSKNSTTFTDSNASQQSLNTAMTVIARELPTSANIVEADDYRILARDHKNNHVMYAYIKKGDESLPKYAKINGKTANIPALGSDSLVEVREFADQANAVATVLVTNVSMQQHETGMPLFTYHGESGEIHPTPFQRADNLKTKRVAVRIVTQTAEGRSRGLEQVTSISLTGDAAASGVISENISRPAAPILYGKLPRPSRDATLWWDHVAGANTYTLYRDNSAIATLGDDENLEFTDPTRAWGSTQTYFVVATGPGGQSEKSNAVNLTVVPQKPTFTNIDPDGAICGNFTVARDLVNCLQWTARSGSVGYRLYVNGESTPVASTNSSTTKATHPRTYGDKTQYYVVAYNVGENGSGGNSIQSDTITLISPPKAPALSGSHKDGDRTLTWTKPENALTYSLSRSVDSAAATVVNFPSANTLSWFDTSAIVGVNFNHSIRASNKAGSSPVSNSALLKPNPGAPTLTGSHSKGDRSVTISVGGLNGVRHEVSRVSPSAKVLATAAAAGSTTVDRETIVNTTFTYSARAWNKTGWGPNAEQVIIKPNPAGTTVTVLDYTDNQDGTNKVSWDAIPNATSYNYRAGSEATESTSATSRSHTPGADTKVKYSVESCNKTGCSAASSATGLQAPGKFTVTTKEWKRSGQRTYASATAWSQDAHPFLDPKASVSWTASPGANNYVMKSGSNTLANGTNRTHSMDINPGTKYTFSVDACGNVSGICRTVQKKVQSSPSGPTEINVRPMVATVNNAGKEAEWASNTRWWTTDYGVPQGSFTTWISKEGVVVSSGYNKGSDWNSDEDSDREWKTWARGNYKTSGYYNAKNANSTNWVGGMQLVSVLLDRDNNFGTFDTQDKRVITTEPQGLDGTFDHGLGSSWVNYSMFRMYNNNKYAISDGWSPNHTTAGGRKYGDALNASNYPNAGFDASGKARNLESVFGYKWNSNYPESKK